MKHAPFSGSKLALIHAGEVLVYLRDNVAGLPFAGMWDLPGGGREGDESPEDCALRELDEEFGLRLKAERLLWRRAYVSAGPTGLQAWFFAGDIHADEIARIRFGSEGQHWRMMALTEFLSDPLAVPHLRARLADCLAERGQAASVRAS